MFHSFLYPKRRNCLDLNPTGRSTPSTQPLYRLSVPRQFPITMQKKTRKNRSEVRGGAKDCSGITVCTPFVPVFLGGLKSEVQHRWLIFNEW